MSDKDIDPWDFTGLDDETTEIDFKVKDADIYAPFPWLSKVACDCGAEKARTTHAHWCSTNGGKR